jgi:hypothetical protein
MVDSSTITVDHGAKKPTCFNNVWNRGFDLTGVLVCSNLIDADSGSNGNSKQQPEQISIC